MMSRKLEKVELEVRRLKCDLCSCEIVDKPYFRVSPQFAYHENHNTFSHEAGYSMPKGTQESDVDVCSPTCLQKNIGALQLLLAAKILPEAAVAYKDFISNRAKRAACEGECEQKAGYR